MLVEEVDDVGSKAFERGLGHLLDMFRATVQYRCALCSPGIDPGFEPKLGGDDHLFTEWREGFAHEFFVRERTVDFSGVEEGDAAFDGRPNQ